jgi:pyridoxine kinase
VKVLSIQSAVAYGHVGNSAAVFPLQRIGVEVMPVYTVNFSNHTGYGAWRGPMIGPDDVRDVILGIEERGVFPQIDVVLSGYQGGEGIADVILDTVARVRAANPAAVYACDPVMGNAKSGCFVAPAIPVLLRERVVPAADIITPNQFELDYLSGIATDTHASVKEAIAAVQLLGPKVVLVTSVEARETPADAIDLIAADGAGVVRVRTPKLSLSVNGAGDAIAALFFVHYARTRSAATALERASASVYGLLRRTAEEGSREILTVAAQDEFVAPSQSFPVERI